MDQLRAEAEITRSKGALVSVPWLCSVGQDSAWVFIMLRNDLFFMVSRKFDAGSVWAKGAVMILWHVGFGGRKIIELWFWGR